MGKYMVIVTETLERIVEVEAENSFEARKKVFEMYKGEEIVLDYNDCVSTDFDVKDAVDDAGASDYPEEISVTWSVDDVLDLVPGVCRTWEGLGMTRKEAAHVLHEVESHHDANTGINWGVLDEWARKLYGDKYLI